MIELQIHSQPDDETCGPTSLHAIYNYYGLTISLKEVIRTVARSISGGTLAPMLGQDALKRNFKTRIYVTNVNIFDPTWFIHGIGNSNKLINKLKTQLKYKNSPDIVQESESYIDYLRLGGEICFKTISVQLLKEYFKQKIPILTGLSATYLYRSPRETYTADGRGSYDDVRGTPCGHFVVLCGYDDKNRLIVVADPEQTNPLSKDNYYKVSSPRLINAIMLGVLTYDANLLIIQPTGSSCKPL